MSEVELLRKIRPTWLSRVVQSTAHGAGVRQDIRQQMERFFDLLEQTVESGDPGWLDPMLVDWASSMTQSDLESETSHLTPFLGEVMQTTLAVCQEQLEPAQALSLINLLIPSFTHAFEKTAQTEVHNRIRYATDELESVRQDIEKLDRSKSDFIAVAAHELKTPLTLIEGYSAMLKDSLGSQAAQETEAALLGGIGNGTRRLREIIDDMIDVSLIDNNLMALNFQPVWISRLLIALGNELNEALQERQQKLTVEPFPGSNQMSFGDPERLLQALRNVISNAIKFTPDGGTIKIDGRLLPGFVEVLVIDNGIGIDPDDQAIIFEKFARLGSSQLHSSGKTKFKGGGPGLGLHISKGIIDAHGGAIWVESPGCDEMNFPGSTFHILLPMRSEPPDTKTARLFAPLMDQANPIKTS